MSCICFFPPRQGGISEWIHKGKGNPGAGGWVGVGNYFPVYTLCSIWTFYCVYGSSLKNLDSPLSGKHLLLKFLVFCISLIKEKKKQNEGERESERNAGERQEGGKERKERKSDNMISVGARIIVQSKNNLVLVTWQKGTNTNQKHLLYLRSS